MIMIWIGRFLSIPLGVVVFALLLVTLVVLEVNDTFLDPDYYPAELRKANIYEFALGDLLSSAIDERRVIEEAIRERKSVEGSQAEVEDTPLLTSGLSTQEIVGSVNRAVPPSYLQGLVEQSFDQFGKYLTGERDEFSVTLRAGEQARTVVSEVKSLMRKADAYNLLYEEKVIPEVERAMVFDLPLNVEVSTPRLIDSIRRIAPPEWVQAQVEGILDEVTPYVVGDRDTFEIRIRLDDKVEIALDEVKGLLREADAYELLYSEVVEPALVENLGESVELPFGVSVTEQEVLEALRRVAPKEWVQEQVERLIDESAPYLTGNEDGFTFDVSLIDNKREARNVIAELVNARLSEVVGDVKECQSLDEARRALQAVSQGLPSCVPPNTPVAEIVSRLGIDVADGVQRFVLSAIPDSISFSDAQLRTALVQAGAGDNLDQLDEVREILREGWSYDQNDLSRDLIQQSGDFDVLVYSDPVELLDDVRAFLKDGWTYTHTDFRDDVSEEGGRQALVQLDAVRDGFKLSRQYRWVAWLPLAILLVLIGFLGGRGWSGRAVWGSVFLVISAGVIFGVFGPGYESFGKSGLIYDLVGVSGLGELREDALRDIASRSGDYPNTARLVANKTFDVAESIADDFASGIAFSALNATIVGLIVLGVAVFWAMIVGLFNRLFRRKERELAKSD